MRKNVTKKILNALLISCMSFGTLSLFGFTTEDEYTGTPYPDGVPHDIPGVVEAEDFDEGGEGVAYHDQPGRQNGSNVYRDTDVDIEQHSGGYNIGFTNSGEWTKYTINATEAGTYSIHVYSVSGNNNGSFHLEIDGKVVCRATDVPYIGGSWSNYSQAAIVKDVQITEGKHIFTWYTYGGMNLDRFEFERTGEWTGEGGVGDFNYPITKKMKNPLFVDFDSPMYESPGIGALYTADGSAHVWADGRLYLYASHDMEPSQGCDRMDRYHVFSTEDMEHWTDHGEILNSSQVPWGRPDGGFMWAPDCAYNPADETYYFYFPHPSGTNWNDSWKIGIATSKEPAANFEVQGYLEGLAPLIDPCVFVDDDGQPYLYHGGGGKCMAGKIDKNDWTKMDGTTQEMEGLVDFHEATWIHKYNGKYYLSYSDGHGTDGNQMRYAMADGPLGPWTYTGIYMYGTGCETNHGSIVEYKDKWYAFYHTSNYSGDGTLRSVCVDPLEYNEDGTIKIVQNYGAPFNGVIRKVVETSTVEEIALTLEAEDFNDGGEHYGYHDKDAENKGINTTYRPDEGVDIYDIDDITYVGKIIKGEWMRYTITVEKTGLYDIDCIVSTNQGSSRFHLSINGTDMTGTLTAAGTVSNWRTVTAKNILLRAGEQYLDFRAEDGDFNVDKFLFRIAEPYKGTPYKDHVIPGTVEAEDYDVGGQGISYFENPWGDDPADVNSGGAYRPNEGVDIQNTNGRIHLSHTSSGEWVKYTLNVTEDGIYDVSIPVSTGAGSASISLTFDDFDDYPPVTANSGGWNTFSNIVVPDVSLTAGKHVMTLNIYGGINIDKFIFELKQQASIDKIKDSSVIVYPNPTRGIFTVNMEKAGSVKVVDINGRTIYEKEVSASSHTIDISKYPAGIYFVTVKTDGISEHRKLIKQ